MGGDYFDAIQVSPDRWITMVADVSGKGMSASLLASSLEALIAGRRDELERASLPLAALLMDSVAKQALAGRVGIDMLAGPSELVVLADDSGLAVEALGALADLMPADRANRFTLIRLIEKAGHDTGNN